MDLLLDDDFDVVLNDRNDLALVEGHDLLKQQIIVDLTVFQRDAIGDLNEDNALRKVRHKTQEALRKHDQVNSIDTIEIERTKADTLSVFIIYNNDLVINEEI